jgi:alpha-L-fucosidase 2
MEDNEDWVLVRAPSQKDLWNPTSPNVADNEPSRPLKVTFSGPAKYWTDAIPIGNGRLGAMVWGGVQNEVLQLNGKSIYLKDSILLSVSILKILNLVAVTLWIFVTIC